MSRCFLPGGSWVDSVSYTCGMLPFVSPCSVMIFQRPATTAPAWPMCSSVRLHCNSCSTIKSKMRCLNIRPGSASSFMAMSFADWPLIEVGFADKPLRLCRRMRKSMCSAGRTLQLCYQAKIASTIARAHLASIITRLTSSNLVICNASRCSSTISQSLHELMVAVVLPRGAI